MYYSAMKRNEILIHAMKWMNLQNILSASRPSQREQGLESPGHSENPGSPGWSRVPEPVHCSHFRRLHLPNWRHLLPHLLPVLNAAGGVQEGTSH